MYGTGRIFAKKVTLDGITFDSEMESIYYKELKAREDNGEVEDIKIHVQHELVPAFTSLGGRKHKPIIYESDFEFFDKLENKHRIIDVKGMLTDDFKIKWKLIDLYLKNEDKGRFLEVLKYSKTTGWVSIEDYKKVMKSKRAQLVAKKNEYKKKAEDLERREKTLKKDITNYNTLKAKTTLTSAEKRRLEVLREKVKDYVN